MKKTKATVVGRGQIRNSPQDVIVETHPKIIGYDIPQVFRQLRTTALSIHIIEFHLGEKAVLIKSSLHFRWFLKTECLF